jgi:hypothetical protein
VSEALEAVEEVEAVEAEAPEMEGAVAAEGGAPAEPAAEPATDPVAELEEAGAHQ